MKFDAFSKYTSKTDFCLPVLQLSDDWVSGMFFVVFLYRVANGRTNYVLLFRHFFPFLSIIYGVNYTVMPSCRRSASVMKVLTALDFYRE